MGAWDSVDPGDLVPPGLAAAVTTLADLVVGLLDAPASLSVPSLPDVPSVNPAAAVATALLDTVEGLLKAGRIHVLAVPIAKTIPLKPPPSLPPTLDDLQASLDVLLGPASTAGASSYADLVQRTGGNAGFFNAFAESLLDPQDSNRPQYEAQHDAVVMATLLIGSPSFAAIASAASTLDMLVRPKGAAGMSSRTIPSPQGLSARVVGTSSKPGVGVRLDWEAPPKVVAPPYFPGVRITVKRYAVIRSTDPRAQSASSVLDLFSTQSLSVGMSTGKSKVIAVGSGANSAYLDADAAIDPKTPQYYAVAWECEVSENGQAASVLHFDRLSNVAKAEVRAPAPSQTGQSPDWVATASAVDAFPGLARATRSMIERSRVLLKPSSTARDKISAAAKLADGAAKRVAARSTELIDDVKRLAAALARPVPRMYVTRMSSTSGGNAFLLAELARLLGDTSDPTRPPFDHGEYVCGVCLVAGAPRLADLAAVIGLFDSLFGPASPDNPLLGVLAAIDTLVTQAETTVFDPGMRPVVPGAAGSVDPTTGRPPVASTPAISASGVPVATSDPQNPNAGDTNVIPIADLC